MDPFRLCLGLGPVTVYLLMLGMINLSRRPFLVTGTRDAAALGLAISGFMIIGPLELVFPDTIATRLGPYASYIWVFLLALYALGLVLVLLWLRPRLVIYNISVDQLRPVLADVVEHLDPETRWAGDSLVLPNLGVQTHIDSFPTLRNVSLMSSGPNQSYAGWRRLETALVATLSQVEVGRNPRGLSLITAGALIGAALILAISQDPHAVAQALFDMLRL